MTAPQDPMAEIRASFFEECEELLESLQDGLQALETGGSDAETINVLFRAVHSIKGGAGAFGLDGLVQFAHGFETALDAMRAGKLAVDPAVLKILFHATDHLADLVRYCREDIPLEAEAGEEILAKLQGVTPADTLEEEPLVIDFAPTPVALDLSQDAGLFALPEDETGETFYFSFAPTAAFYRDNREPLDVLQALQSLGVLQVSCNAIDLPALPDLSLEDGYLHWEITLQSTHSLADIKAALAPLKAWDFLELHAPFDEPSQDETGISPQTTAPSAAPSQEPIDAPAPSSAADMDSDAPRPSQTATSTPVVRVNLDRIERLVNLVGELVINQAMLSQSLEQAGLSPHSDAMHGLEEFQRLTRDIQDSVMMIRAQPVKSLFQRMSRIVRETSAAVGKDVRLHTSGEATEVDKTVIERLADPLTHMIRNAVDHGLEPSEKRLAAGKSAEGNVSLSAVHRSGRVMIDISDDGAGIDRDKVLEIAIRKGLVPAEATLSQSEIDNLLFMPGFSTSSEVSDLSGRGVGMDVVRTAIQALGGRISITSTPGEGTCFSISLPLTLAVLDGMVIDVAGETLVLPLNLVIETVTLSGNDVEMLRPDAMIVRVRDGFVPLIDLGKELGYRAPVKDMQGRIVLLIAHEDGSRAALLIDDIVDQRQVVIKGLDESLYRAPGIAAATILGDGQIALILDPSDIISYASRTASPPPSALREGIPA